MMMYENFPITRRRMLLLAPTALVAAGLPWRAHAQTRSGGAPAGPVAQLDSALLTAMKAGSRRASFAARYAALAPVIEQVFELETVLAASVGFSWPSLSSQQKAALSAAFRRYTVATYVANFDSYNGQHFEILPGVREVGNGEVVVRSRLIRRSRAPAVLDYVMRQGLGWKIVDVLTDGSISRVAVQRSDFGELLANGGESALAAGLARKATELSDGVV